MDSPALITARAAGGQWKLATLEALLEKRLPADRSEALPRR